MEHHVLGFYAFVRLVFRGRPTSGIESILSPAGGGHGHLRVA